MALDGFFRDRESLGRLLHTQTSNKTGALPIRLYMDLPGPASPELHPQAVEPRAWIGGFVFALPHAVQHASDIVHTATEATISRSLRESKSRVFFVAGRWPLS
jgi:hypothetical protein